MKTHFLNSWRPVSVFLLGALFCVLGPQQANAQLANPQTAPANVQPAQTTDPYLNQLKDANAFRREDAYWKLADFDQRLHDSVLTLLDELKKNPERGYGSSFEMTLRVVSAMNIRGALDVVGGMIDFQLDPATFPHGGFGAPIEYYPVARIAIELNNGQKTTDLVLTRFGSKASDTTLRVYTYVLQQVLGGKIANFVLQGNLDNINKSLAAVPTAAALQTNKINLEGALKLLDSDEPMLKMPEGA